MVAGDFGVGNYVDHKWRGLPRGIKEGDQVLVILKRNSFHGEVVGVWNEFLTLSHVYEWDHGTTNDALEMVKELHISLDKVESLCVLSREEVPVIRASMRRPHYVDDEGIVRRK